MPPTAGPITARFWCKVVPCPPTECWLWAGATNGRYGIIGSRKGGSPFYAHRLAYEMTRGEIPAGAEILHTCDVPLCVNPAHLRTGSRLDNVRDSIAKGRHRFGFRPGHHRPRGASSPNAKLTQAQAEELRRLRRKGMNLYELGRRFGVAYQTVSKIVRMERYRDGA